jgi:hypothetical protein
MVSASLFSVHRDLANPRKDAKGQVRGRADYRYLSLPALIDHLKPHLKDGQLFVLQEDVGDDGHVALVTTIMHFSGQFIELGPLIMPAPADPQQRGSALSYARRYALAAAFNLAADEDDDAAKATRTLPGGTTPRQPDGGATTSSRAVGTVAPVTPSAADRPVPAADTGSDPASLGEGGNGSEPTTLDGTDALATDQQWHDLLKRAKGKTGQAVKLIDEANGTQYATYRNARDGATWAELVKAMTT